MLVREGRNSRRAWNCLQGSPGARGPRRRAPAAGRGRRAPQERNGGASWSRRGPRWSEMESRGWAETPQESWARKEHGIWNQIWKKGKELGLTENFLCFLDFAFWLQVIMDLSWERLSLPHVDSVCCIRPHVSGMEGHPSSRKDAHGSCHPGLVRASVSGARDENMPRALGSDVQPWSVLFHVWNPSWAHRQW